MAQVPRFKFKRRSLAVLLIVILGVAFAPRTRRAVVAAPDVSPAAAEVFKPEPAAPQPKRVEPAPVRVRVIDAGGAPLAGVGVRARVTDSRGAELLDAFSATDATGLASFPGLAELAQQFEPGSQLAVSFDEPRPGKLRFGTKSLPARELILVRTGAAEAKAAPDDAVAEDESGERETAKVEVATTSPTGPEIAEVVPDTKPDGPSNDPELATPAPLVREAESDQAGEAVSTLTPTLVPAQVAAPTPIVAPMAEQPLSVEPLAPGRLSGRVQLDAGVPANELRVELQEVLPGQPGLRGRRLGPVALAEDGSFHFDGIAPGLCSVRLSLWGSTRTLAWVDDLEVLPGEELRDERLLPFALSGRLIPIDIELFDTVGRRLDLAVVAPLDAKSGGVGSLRVQRIGATPRLWCDRRALDGEGGLDLVLEAPGFRTREEFARSEELASGSPLRFALEPEHAKALELRLISPPPEGAELEVRLMRPDGGERPWDFARHRGLLDARGRLRLEPAETGDFVVRVFDVADGAARDLGLVVPVTVLAEEITSADPAEVEVLFLPLNLTAVE